MTLTRFLSTLALFAVSMTGGLWFVIRQVESGRWPAPLTGVIANTVALIAASIGLLLFSRSRRRGARS